jgi:hypothetical protein
MNARISKELGPGGYERWLPVYDLEAATSGFGPSVAAECMGWMPTPEDIKPDGRHFVAKVLGRAMEPLIPDGSYCVFRAGVMGALTSKTVLVQHWAISDPETGGSYTVRMYRSRKALAPDSGDEPGWHHTAIQLLARNEDFPPISIAPDQAEELRVIAELVHVIGK